jgi:heme exporter protein C
MRGTLFDKAIMLLWAITTIGMVIAIYLVFVHAPEERVMGAAQKIFYFHVPIAMLTFLSVFVLLAGSVGYLWTRNLAWDHLSRAATETGLLFCSIVLLTGPIWARPAWGVWWTWEARLTTTLLLWLLLVAALMVRNYADNRDLGARLASIVGVVAAIDVPIIYKAVDWWRGQHPILFKPGEKPPLAPEMATAFFVCLAVFFSFFLLLLAVRYRLAVLEERTTRVLERATAY